MAAYITNFDTFYKEECGIPFPGVTTGAPFITGIQKSSINTIDSFCMNPYGQVNNMDCPDWDPVCNCWITQFMPGITEPPGMSLDYFRKSINECELMNKELNQDQQINEWAGVDFSNPYSTYNCPICDPNLQQPVDIKKIKKLEYYKINGSSPLENIQGKPFIYAQGISGISGGITLSGNLEIDEPGDDIESTDWRINGVCFPLYLEYSKTNATFWNTLEKTPLLRKGQVNALQAQKIKILVNGRYEIKPGSLVRLKIPIGDETSNILKEKRFGGRWMVYRIERVITKTKHSMYLYLMRDGYP